MGNYSLLVLTSSFCNLKPLSKALAITDIDNSIDANEITLLQITPENREAFPNHLTFILTGVMIFLCFDNASNA